MLALVLAVALTALTIRHIFSHDLGIPIADLHADESDPSAAAPSLDALRRGESGPFGFASAYRAGGTIRGHVRTTAGAAIGGAVVRAVGRLHVGAEGIESTPVRTSADGSYEIEAVGATSFTVCAEAKDFAPGVQDRARAGDVVDFELVAAATIDGLVIDDQGAPVAGVAVSLVCLLSGISVERATVSDRDGKWRLTELPTTTPDTIWLNAEAAGFGSYLTRELWFSELPPTSRFTIVLRPGGPVRGTLLDAATGKPIAGGKVEIARSAYSGPSAQVLARFRTVGESTTDGTGGFRIGAVPAPSFGDHLVSIASAPGYAPSTDQLPAVGDGRELSLQVRLWPAASVKGRVVDPRGRPLGSVRVSVDRWWGGSDSVFGSAPAGTVTASDGSWRLEGVPANGHPAAIAAAAVSGQRGWGRLDSVPTKAGEVTQAPDLVLQMAPAAKIRVKDAEGRPVAGAIVETFAYQADMQTWFTDSAGLALVSFQRHPNTSDPEYTRVSAMGYVDLLPDPFVPSADAPPEVVLTLTRALEMTCQVRWADKSDAAGVQVGIARGNAPIAAIWPIKGEPSRDESKQELVIATAETGADGRCMFQALPPPPWHLAVWTADGDEPSFRVESVRDASKELLITVEEERPASRTAPETVDLDVVVNDAVSGKPILDASVHVDSGKARPSGLGIYRCEGVARGAVKISASAREYPKAWSHTIDLRIPGSERVEVRLEPGATVGGRATFPRGTALTGASIRCFWSSGKGGGGRSAPIQASGEFELLGIPPGVDFELSVQGGNGTTFMTYVPAQFLARAIPVSVRELRLDLEFVPACHTTFRVLDRREGRGSLDSFELSVRAKDGSWSRDWQCPGYGFSAWMPVGPVIAKCTVYGSAPVTVHHDLQSDVDEVPFTVR